MATIATTAAPSGEVGKILNRLTKTAITSALASALGAGVTTSFLSDPAIEGTLIKMTLEVGIPVADFNSKSEAVKSGLASTGGVDVSQVTLSNVRVASGRRVAGNTIFDVTVDSVYKPPSTTAAPAESSSSDDKTGAIVGGVLGGVFGALILVGGGYYLYQSSNGSMAKATPPNEPSIASGSAGAYQAAASTVSADLAQGIRDAGSGVRQAPASTQNPSGVHITITT